MRKPSNGDGLPAPGIRRQVTLRDTAPSDAVKWTTRELPEV